MPTAAEQAAVAKNGQAAIAPILDELMKEDAFYDRVREGFNDIFVTLGIGGALEAEVLAYGTNNGPAGVAVTAEVPIGLHATDDGLDSRAAAELAFDHSEDAALLARDEDAARVFGLWPR